MAPHESLTPACCLESFRKAAAQFPYMPQALAMVWQATRVYTLAWGVLLVIQGVLPVATVYLTRMLVDGIADGFKAGGSWESVRPTLILVALMALVMLLADLLRSIASWVRTGQSELFQDHIRNLIHEKSVAVDLAFYESPEFYDHLHRARYEASHRPLSLMENLGSLVQNGITLVAMSAVLLQFGLWLPAALLLTTIPALVGGPSPARPAPRSLAENHGRTSAAAGITTGCSPARKPPRKSAFSAWEIISAPPTRKCAGGCGPSV